MLKWISTAALLAVMFVVGLAVAGVSPAFGWGDDHKTTICHVPPGNPENAQTITIDDHALKAHLGDNAQGLHGGDYYGPCQDDTTSTETTSTGTTTTETTTTGTTTTTETTTTSTTPTAPCPNGEPPIHGKDGEPGNDACDPCLPPVNLERCPPPSDSTTLSTTTETTTSSPTTTESTETTVTEPETTTTETSTTPIAPKPSKPKHAKPKPSKPHAPAMPPPCPVAKPASGVCGVQGSG